MSRADEIARRHLKPEESSVPQEVLTAVEQLLSLGIWFSLGRNDEATSCRDAAAKRVRLGHRGIELWKELKTFFGVYETTDGDQRFLLVHCPGDCEIDLTRVRKAVRGAKNLRRAPEEMLAERGLRFGEINPVTFAHDPGITQIFDASLKLVHGPPDTVMTNAGHREWSVEFRIADLVSRLPNARYANVVDARMPARYGFGRGDFSIAILTGNAPESGMLLMQRTLDLIRQRFVHHCLGDVSLPRIEVVSEPVLGLTMELDTRRDQIKPELEKILHRMCRNRPTVLALACNTTHFFTPLIRRVCDQYGVHFVSMPEAIGERMRAAGAQQVALVGTRFVADFTLGLSAYKEALTGLEVVPASEEVLAQLTEIAYMVKQYGARRQELAQLRATLAGVPQDTIVVALTELSMLLALEKSSEKARGAKRLLDPLQIYAEALAARFVGNSLP